jgi:hypothetical protein
MFRRAAISMILAAWVAFPAMPLLADGQPRDELVIKDGVHILSTEGATQRMNKSEDATLENLVNFLLKRYTNDNIVLEPGVGEIRIDNLKYRESDDPSLGGGAIQAGGALQTELQALAVASGGKFKVRVQSYAVGGAMGMYFLENTHAKQNEKVVEVFNMASFIERRLNKIRAERPSLTPQEFQDASAFDVARQQGEIEEICKSTAESLGLEIQNLSFKFYRDAQLLVVIGPPEAIDVARKVVDALLERSPESRPDVSDRLSQPAAPSAQKPPPAANPAQPPDAKR